MGFVLCRTKHWKIAERKHSSEQSRQSIYLAGIMVWITQGVYQGGNNKNRSITPDTTMSHSYIYSCLWIFSVFPLFLRWKITFITFHKQCARFPGDLVVNVFHRGYIFGRKYVHVSQNPHKQKLPAQLKEQCVFWVNQPFNELKLILHDSSGLQQLS